MYFYSLLLATQWQFGPLKLVFYNVKHILSNSLMATSRRGVFLDFGCFIFGETTRGGLEDL